MKKVILRGCSVAAMLSLVITVPSMFLDLGVVRVLRRLFFICCTLGILASVTAFLYGGISEFFRKKKPSSYYATILVITCVFCFYTGFQGFVLESIANSKARNEIKSILRQMDFSRISITLDDVEVREKAVLFKALQGLQAVSNKGGRSRKECKITDGNIELLIGISKNNLAGSQSLLVYYPKYHMMIGGFCPDTFDLDRP